MATFPKPLCELRVLLGHHESARSPRRGIGAKKPEAGGETPPFDARTPSCRNKPDSSGDAGCDRES